MTDYSQTLQASGERRRLTKVERAAKMAVYLGPPNFLLESWGWMAFATEKEMQRFLQAPYARSNEVKAEIKARILASVDEAKKRIAQAKAEAKKLARAEAKRNAPPRKRSRR